MVQTRVTLCSAEQAGIYAGSPFRIVAYALNRNRCSQDNVLPWLLAVWVVSKQFCRENGWLSSGFLDHGRFSWQFLPESRSYDPKIPVGTWKTTETVANLLGHHRSFAMKDILEWLGNPSLADKPHRAVGQAAGG